MKPQRRNETQAEGTWSQAATLMRESCTGFRQMKKFSSRNYSAFAVSMAVHVVIMLAMWMYRFNVLGQDEIVVETIFTNERLHQEYSQELEQTEIAEQITLVSGGMVSTAVGASSDPTLNRVKIEKLESLQDILGLRKLYWN